MSQGKTVSQCSGLTTHRTGLLELKFLHCGPEEQLFANGTTSGRQGKDWVLKGSKAKAVHRRALWPQQRSSDVSTVSGDRLMKPHLQVKSRVPRRRNRGWWQVPRAPAQLSKKCPEIPRIPPIAQCREVPTLSKGSTVHRAYCIARRDNNRHRETDSLTGMTDPEEQIRN
jgi:hypothetical protein